MKMPNRYGFKTLAILFALFVFGRPFALQAKAQEGGQKPSASGAPVYEYEVASFKAAKAGGIGFAVRLSFGPDNLTASNVPLILLIQQAYGMQSYQISGGPDWLRSDRYNVEAKIDSDTVAALQRMSPDERQQTRQKMLQTLLTQRLHLEVQRTTKELPVYELVVGKNGPKLNAANTAEIAAATASTGAAAEPSSALLELPADASRVTFGPGGATQKFSMTVAPISALAAMLSNRLRRPVIDKTGLGGRYDIQLEVAPDQNTQSAINNVMKAESSARGSDAPAPVDSAGPSIFDALQNQLGLKLESAKGPVETVVVVRAETPGEN